MGMLYFWEGDLIVSDLMKYEDEEINWVIVVN